MSRSSASRSTRLALVAGLLVAAFATSVVPAVAAGAAQADGWTPPTALHEDHDGMQSWDPPLVVQQSALPMVMRIEQAVVNHFAVAQVRAGVEAFNGIDGSRWSATLGPVTAARQNGPLADGVSTIYLLDAGHDICRTAYAHTARRHRGGPATYVNRHGAEAFLVDEVDIGLCTTLPAASTAIGVAHEIAHGMGFSHLSGSHNRCRLTYGGLTGCQTLDLSVADINAVRHVYPAAPRLAGADRDATSAFAAEQVTLTSQVVAVIGRGDVVTAVSAAAWAGSTDARFVMIDRDCNSGAGVAAISAWRAERNDLHVTVVGADRTCASQLARATGVSSTSLTRTELVDRHLADTAADQIVLVRGVDAAGQLADGLTAAAAAGPLGAPVVTTSQDGRSLSVEAQRAVDSLRVRRVLIIGGEHAVSAELADSLRARGLVVSRVSGADRIATSIAVAGTISSDDVVVIASGWAWPDAVAGSAMAGARGWPVLLSRPGSLPNEVAQAMSPAGAARVVGGASVLTTSVVSAASQAVR